MLLCALAVLAGCAGGEDRETPSSVTGFITEIEPESGTPEKFVLESGAETYEIHLAAETDYGFDLQHLREHLRDRLPVRCALEERDGDLYALEIVDA